MKKTLALISNNCSAGRYDYSSSSCSFCRFWWIQLSGQVRPWFCRQYCPFRGFRSDWELHHFSPAASPPKWHYLGIFENSWARSFSILRRVLHLWSYFFGPKWFCGLGHHGFGFHLSGSHCFRQPAFGRWADACHRWCLLSQILDHADQSCLHRWTCWPFWYLSCRSATGSQAPWSFCSSICCGRPGECFGFELGCCLGDMKRLLSTVSYC